MRPNMRLKMRNFITERKKDPKKQLKIPFPVKYTEVVAEP
jgi:hypothetical protein